MIIICLSYTVYNLRIPKQKSFVYLEFDINHTLFLMGEKSTWIILLKIKAH